MLIHFLNEYKVLGRVGDKIKIKGMFPGIEVDDFVYLGSESEGEEEDRTFRIERIEYDFGNEFNDSFGAVIVREN
jgi:hypothetical protein